jgi:5-methylcytosine-specific restriction enzyme A
VNDVAAYLLTWNPTKYLWEQKRPGELARSDRESRRGQTVSLGWSCGNSTLPRRGDRGFLIKLGPHGRGVFASGWLSEGSKRATNGEWGPRNVTFDCDVFLNPNIAGNLLDPVGIEGQLWTPQVSGITIKPEAHARLEAEWTKHIDNVKGRVQRPRDTSREEAIDAVELESLEGTIRERIVKHRQRERSIREHKLSAFRNAHGRLFCEVCGFDFVDTFGVEYAEVHHLKPLASRDEPSKTRISDLAVLCANCHRVAHIDPANAKSLAQLKAMRRS